MPESDKAFAAVDAELHLLRLERIEQSLERLERLYEERISRLEARVEAIGANRGSIREYR